MRQYVGYARFDTPEQVAALYADMSVYYNLFQSVLHLVEKTVVSDLTVDRRHPDLDPRPASGDSGKGIRPHVSDWWRRGRLLPTQQQHLQALYSQNNPLALRHRLPSTLRRLVNGKE